MTKRIAMLTDNADPLAPLGGAEAGGENVYVSELSRALGRLGWVVDIFTRWSYPKTAQIAQVAKNVRVVRLPAGPIEFIPKEKLFRFMPEYVTSFLAFREKARHEYLLLHGNYYLSGWAGVEIANVLHVPMVNTFHTLGIVKHQALGSQDPSPKDRITLEREIMVAVDRIIATSPVMKEELVSLYEVPAKKIAVISEGANLKRFMPTPQLLARRVLRISSNRMIVLYVGRFERRKGIDTLLSAMYELAARMPEKRKILRLYISGGEPKRRWKNELNAEKDERERLKKIVDQLGIADMVRIIGGVDRETLPFYYSAADVTVVPSYYEPFGLVPIESMACGTPVVASNVGGMKWTIKDGKTGFLAKARDPVSFAEKIRYILDHTSVSKHMRENGIERVRRFFNWDIIGAEMSAFYHDLIIEYFWNRTRKNSDITSPAIKAESLN